MSFGVSADTLAKTWLSVMTILGFLPKVAKVSRNSNSFTTIAVASASRISRIVCCCGRISLPLGAALSIGMTRTAKSPGCRISPTIFSLLSSVTARAAIFSLSNSMW